MKEGIKKMATKVKPNNTVVETTEVENVSFKGYTVSLGTVRVSGNGGAMLCFGKDANGATILCNIPSEAYVQKMLTFGKGKNAVSVPDPSGKMELSQQELMNRGLEIRHYPSVKDADGNELLYELLKKIGWNSKTNQRADKRTPAEIAKCGELLKFAVQELNKQMPQFRFVVAKGDSGIFAFGKVSEADTE